ncbi:MAG: DNA translocase FtsK 4TM domain-containing protein [Ruminococcus sp.]|nr:DNA translocase FtsK 4TM domain-containing protein [Ruminococcus sp.]
MPAKKKKAPMGAEFRDEELTSKGKPKKKKANENIAEPEDDKEQNRIWSVILFALGVLIALMTFIPGTAGWHGIHTFMLGLFGISAFLVPVVLIYTSVLIGLEKDRDNVTGRAILGIVMTLLICSAIQVFMVGEIPGHSLGEHISKVYYDGTQLKGGGLAGLPISGLLLSVMGKLGARILTVILFFVIALLLTGKSLIEFLKMLAAPFVFVSRLFTGEEEDLPEDDEPAAVPDKPVRVRKTADRRADSSVEDLEAVAMVNAQAPAEVKTQPEAEGKVGDDEFSMFFDIPLPNENREAPAAAAPAPAAEAKPAEAPADGGNDINIDIDLENLITKAADEKAKRDGAAAEEAEEVPEEPVQQQLYILPSIELLTPPEIRSNPAEAAAEMREKADNIVNTLKSFGIDVKIRNIYRGPSITRYEIQPGAGVRVSKIKGLEDDICLSLAAQGVRIEAPIPGKAAVGIEVPNINKDNVTLREILSSSEFRSSKSKLAFAVGKDITGNAIVGDITKMPHVIIAGTTGSGKSVCTRSIIMSLLYNAKPDEVKLILIDPKMVEFKVFDGIPHLLIPIITQAEKAAGALNWAVLEMMRRYNIFAEVGANDLKSYNELSEDDEELAFMPQIVIFIDELADLMLVAGKEVEDYICRLAQMGRAAGMHLVVATQRPTTDVITGLIKANIPSRIALSVMSQVDSRTIIDMAGADKLLGNGDMLYMPIGSGKPIRVQGCFASPRDINETLTFIRSQMSEEYDSNIIEAVENYVPQTGKGDKSGSSDSGFEVGSDEDYIIRAAEVAVNNGQLSTTMLQKKLKLGYARASRIIDELEERGIIGPSEGSKPRKVLMSKMQFDDWKLRMQED